MEFSRCAQCGTEIKGQGIHYRGHGFCSDKCCDEFDAEITSSSEPDETDLSSDDMDDMDDNLGYRNDDDSKDEYDEDEFAIKPEDF